MLHGKQLLEKEGEGEKGQRKERRGRERVERERKTKKEMRERQEVLYPAFRSHTLFCIFPPSIFIYCSQFPNVISVIGHMLAIRDMVDNFPSGRTLRRK